MFYAWITATDFGGGGLPRMKSQSLETLLDRMRKVEAWGGRFFTAMQIDGTWVDLTVYGPGIPPEGRPVSEARSNRYVRARARRLEELGQDEVNWQTPLVADRPEDLQVASQPVPSFAATQAPLETPEDPTLLLDQVEDPPERERVMLSVDPRIARSIFGFLALDPEARDAAVEALQALSLSAEPFKVATEVMLDDTKELIVGLSDLPEEPAPEG